VLLCVLFVFILYLMLHVACVSVLSILDCPFSLLCCFVFCLSSFYILCSIKLNGQSRVEHMMQNEDKQNTIQHSKLKGQTRMDNTETQVLDFPFSLLCCFVLCLSSFYILCSMLPVSLYCPFLIAPLVYCVALCFVKSGAYDAERRQAKHNTTQ
jgi:uncharacterized protein YceK